MASDVGHLGQYAVTGGPGRPKGSKTKATRHKALVADAVSEREELLIWDKIRRMALDGDLVAARMIMEYLCGKPKQSHEIDLDLGLQHISFTVAPSPKSEDTDHQ